MADVVHDVPGYTVGVLKLRNVSVGEGVGGHNNWKRSRERVKTDGDAVGNAGVAKAAAITSRQ